jgi:putative transposase
MKFQVISTLKERHQRVSLGRLCLLFGITRQAYYSHYEYIEALHYEQQLVVQEVLSIRNSHPRMGTRKLYELLEPFMLAHKIKMGRDALFVLLAAHGLLVRRRRRRVAAIYRAHTLRKYPNLSKDRSLRGPNQLWVSDITYWKLGGVYVYLSLITDAYSHKIVGYHLGESLEAIHSIRALEMALASVEQPIVGLMHHSDRGIQYCSKPYINLLEEQGIAISMAAQGAPLENSIAERVNGIIKGEYLHCYAVRNISEGHEVVKKVIRRYNEERPHMSIGYMKPSELHAKNQKTSNLWKHRYPV